MICRKTLETQDLKIVICRKTLETQDLKISICNETLETQDLKIFIVARPWNFIQFYSSKFGQSRLNRFYQPKARYKDGPDSKLGSVRLEIAARLKARFSARDSMTRLDLARAGHCRSGLGSPRLGLTLLGSARLATLGSTHLRSWPRLSMGLRIWTGESTRCSTRLNSEFGSAQFGVRSEIGSGLATRDLVWLGSEESELSSFYLDRSIARPIWSRLISVRKLL